MWVFINDTEKSVCVTSIYYHQNMRNLENTKLSLFKFPNKKNKSTYMRLHCVSRIEGTSKFLPQKSERLHTRVLNVKNIFLLHSVTLMPIFNLTKLELEEVKTRDRKRERKARAGC